jgi:hypothetical protein
MFNFWLMFSKWCVYTEPFGPQRPPRLTPAGEAVITQQSRCDLLAAS